MAEIAAEFLAAIQAGASQEEAGRQAAEANIDMIVTNLAEQILAKTDAAVADQRTRQARITTCTSPEATSSTPARTA
jgi:hypothetical protein